MKSNAVTDYPKNADNELEQVMRDCLGIPLIRREIMEHCSTSTLLKISLVNKQWNYEARTVLRDRGMVTTRKMTYVSSCEHLGSFASSLPHMNVIPFSGMSINLREGCSQPLFAELDPALREILDLLPWKHLSVSLLKGWEMHKHCPAFLLLKEILNKFSCVFEEFSLVIESRQRQLIEQVIQHCNLRRLKSLKIRDDWGTIEDKTNLIQTLVSRAPILQVLHTEGRVNLNANLLQGTSAVHLTNYRYSPSSDEIPESVLGPLRMEKIRLLSFTENFSLERFNRITPVLLQNSCALLSSMEIAVIFLVPLTLYGIGLGNVKNIMLYVNIPRLELFKPTTLRLVQDFDFTRIFPCLKEIHSFVFSQPNAIQRGPMNEMMEQLNVTSKEPSPDRAVNIKSLCLSYSSALEEFTIQFLAKMNPHIEQLTLDGYNGLSIPYILIWDSNWVELKQLEIRVVGSKNGERGRVNLDSVFCGIFPEEVAELQGKDDEYLRSVTIVPVMPSITCMKGLRTFRLFYVENDEFSEPFDDPTYLFSKVTGFLAFRRCPGLTVTLGTSDKILGRALRHLLPYASVVHGNMYLF